MIQSFSSNKISYQKNNVVIFNIAYAFFGLHINKNHLLMYVVCYDVRKKIIVVVVCMHVVYYVAGCCYILHDIKLLLLDFSPLNLTDISCHV
jgi:hypothetical protein